MKGPEGRGALMHAAFAWCAGPAAAHATLHLPAAPADAPDLAHLRAARAAVARGDLAEAVRQFDEALQLAPECAVAHLGRTICLAGLGRAEDAALSFQHGLEAAGSGPDMAHQLSRLAAREGNAALAMDLLAPALEQRPDLGARVLDDPAYRGMRDHPRLLVMLGRL